EQVVTGDEVGLRIDLDHHALLALDREPDQSLGSDAAALLGRLGETLLAQEIDRLLHVAAGLLQRRLAVHHSRARALTQLFHHLRADIGHKSISSWRSCLAPSTCADLPAIS